MFLSEIEAAIILDDLRRRVESHRARIRLREQLATDARAERSAGGRTGGSWWTSIAGRTRRPLEVPSHTPHGVDADLPARILVPLEGSEQDPGVIRLAGKLAMGSDAEVVLIRVVRPPDVELPERDATSSYDLGNLIDRLERTAHEELRGHERALDGLRSQRIVLIGHDPAGEILTWLRAHPVDLVVMPLPVRTGVRRLLRRRLADRVLRSRLAPVVSLTAI